MKGMNVYLTHRCEGTSWQTARRRSDHGRGEPVCVCRIRSRAVLVRVLWHRWSVGFPCQYGLQGLRQPAASVVLYASAERRVYRGGLLSARLLSNHQRLHSTVLTVDRGRGHRHSSSRGTSGREPCLVDTPDRSRFS